MSRIHSRSSNNRHSPFGRAGIQNREVSCIHELARGEGNTLTVADSECPLPRPADNQLCNMVPCPVRWQPGPWSEVSL